MIAETELPCVYQSPNLLSAAKITRSLDWYFKPKPWESRVFYERIGIKHFTRLTQAFWGLQHRLSGNQAVASQVFHRADLGSLDRLSKTAELARLPLVTILTAETIYSAFQGYPVNAAVLAGADLLLGIYPVMLQRYNRMRVTEIISKRIALQQPKI